ncbi:hypothetical protein [Methylobacterium crusticola]|nr:hypothetical protein [Methylobacterium crusticola]
MTVRTTQGTPTLREAARTLGVPKRDVDRAFGVVPVDGERGLFAVKVRVGAASEGAASSGEGVFSNPRIATFGRR